MGPSGIDPVPGAAGLRAMTTRELVAALAQEASLLARKEIALAKSEARQDLAQQIRSATGLGVAGACALCALDLLLVAAALALTEAGVFPGWLSALVVAAAVLAVGSVAGVVGWKRRVRRPLDATRRSLEESVRWAKERMA